MGPTGLLIQVPNCFLQSGKDVISQFSIELLCAEDLPDCVELQQLVWNFDRNDLVSDQMLATCQNYGGILLGARMSDGSLGGFAFSFPAIWKEQIHQHSHMLAVREELQDRGIGIALKFAQYKEARLRGFQMLTWTFDPLETKNAHLNLNKIGVIVQHYYINLYGEQTSSELHSGLGTDRFLAEWVIEKDNLSTNICFQLKPDEMLSYPQIMPTRIFEHKWLAPDTPNLTEMAPRLLVEVPKDIQGLKRHSLKLAMDWRLQIRKVFTLYFSRGYQVSRLLISSDCEKDNNSRMFYLLEVQEKRGSVS